MPKKTKQPVWRNLDATLEELNAIYEGFDRFVFFDTETTGLNPSKDKVIQISGIMTDHELNVIQMFDELANPAPLVISEKIEHLTGISNEMVADARSERLVLEEFLERAKGCAYFAYNSPFDVEMVTGSMESYGVSIHMTHFDVLRFARDVLANESIKQFNLQSVSEFLSVTPEGENFHNALFDVKSTIAVFKELLARSQNVQMPCGFSRPKVYSIRVWQMGANKRLYITTGNGVVWYDQIRQVWGSKSAPLTSLDMSYIEAKTTRMAQEAGFDSLRKVNRNIFSTY